MSIFGGDSITVNIAENVGDNSLVYTPIRTNPSEYFNFNYSIVNDYDSASFQIYSGFTGDVYIITNPVYNDQSRYIFILKLTMNYIIYNNDIPEIAERSVEQEVTVNIINNNNDDYITFKYRDIYHELPENKNINDEIIPRPDIINLDKLTPVYSAPNLPTFLFLKSTGEITLRVQVNFEDTTPKEYNFILFVTSTIGNNSQTDNQNIKLKITNIKDQFIRFKPKIINVNLREDTNTNVVVLNAPVINDVDLNVPVIINPDDLIPVYSTTNLPTFLFLKSTGEITLRVPVNFEDTTPKEYNFTLIVTSTIGNISQTNNQNIKLNITNLVESLSFAEIDGIRTIVINENIFVVNPVYTPNILNPENTTISYNISEHDSNDFTVTPMNGFVYLKASPNFEAKDKYKFKITAKDTINNISVFQMVNVNINNLIDEYVTFKSNSITIDLLENTKENDVVLASTNIKNPDKIPYLVSQTGLPSFLTLDPNTGVITLNDLVDHDRINEKVYTFILRVTSMIGTANKFFDQTVKLTIKDVKDEKVTFQSATRAIDLPENKNKNDVVSSAPGITNLDKVPFMFSSIGLPYFLELNTVSGVIILKELIDFDTIPTKEYIFTLGVNSTTINGSETDNQTITLTILSVINEVFNNLFIETPGLFEINESINNIEINLSDIQQSLSTSDDINLYNTYVNNISDANNTTFKSAINKKNLILKNVLSKIIEENTITQHRSNLDIIINKNILPSIITSIISGNLIKLISSLSTTDNNLNLLRVQTLDIINEPDYPFMVLMDVGDSIQIKFYGQPVLYVKKINNGYEVKELNSNVPITHKEEGVLYEMPNISGYIFKYILGSLTGFFELLPAKQCVCPKPAIPKQGISFGGNLNIPGHEETQAFRTSYQLINSLYTNGGRTQFYNAQQNRSSKPPPRNTFG